MEEKIICAAVKTSDDMVAIQLGIGRHNNIIHHLARSGFKTPVSGEQGFITSSGRFVDRIEAREIAIKAGQCKDTEYPQLYSEDLW